MTGTSRRAIGRIAAAATIVAASLAVLNGAGVSASPTDPSAARQAAFGAAAAEFGVPDSVLLGVSYLQSRWDTNNGTPSTTGGYGPMHLTDAAPLLVDGGNHDHGDEDARGDETRPTGPLPTTPTVLPARLQTAHLAAELTGADVETLKSDPAQNIRGGAALLAHYQHAAGAAPSPNPADWYRAVSTYGGSDQFADEVFAQIRQGADRVTDDGQQVSLIPTDVATPASASSREQDPNVECPINVDCEWIPAPYQDLGGGDYGNHDLSERPERQAIRYIVVHDTEGSYETTLRLVQDPNYVSWQYTLRSSDGHIAQHVNSKDVAWHAGNWYVNAKAIGLEHEGFAAQGTWYTEAMYRTSARLVRYLAMRFDIPLNRHHIIGHDQIPGILPANVRGMHWDPGPYWNWNHYFALMGAPIIPTGFPGSGMVTMKPNWDTNMPAFTGCTRAGVPCPLRSSSSVILHSQPSFASPLVVDIGLHPDGSPSTMHISDHGARASSGTQWAVAEVRGDWTAIWYLGQKAWFHNPRTDPAAVWATGLVITPKAGRATIPVYGRAYPEPAAYPPEIPVQAIVPLQYTLHAGERYAVGQYSPGEYYRAVTYNCSGPGDCTVVRGQNRYYQIQFGHRMMFVNAADVDVHPSFLGR